MRFPNAYEGVKKIRTATILSIVAIILTFLTVLLAGIALASAAGGSSGGALGGAALAGLVGIGAGVVAIIGFIMQIIGINKAKIDEAEFSKAMTFLIIAIVASVISSVVSNAIVKAVFSLASSACSAYVTVCIIAGIASLSVQAGDSVFASTATSSKNTIIILYAAEIVLNFVAGLLTGTASTLITLVGSVAGIVALVMFLKILTGAEEMLRKAIIEPTPAADGENSNPYGF